MKLKDLEVGKTYKCILSGFEMLVVTHRKQTGQEPTGKKDEEGNDIMIPTIVDVYAGKFVQEQQGVIQFIFNELYDGQLEEIK